MAGDVGVANELGTGHDRERENRESEQERQRSFSGRERGRVLGLLAMCVWARVDFNHLN